MNDQQAEKARRQREEAERVRIRGSILKGTSELQPKVSR